MQPLGMKRENQTQQLFHYRVPSLLVLMDVLNEAEEREPLGTSGGGRGRSERAEAADE